jgi:hypothetical protein
VREAEESPLLEAVVRERLMKTQQNGEILAGVVVTVNCEIRGGVVISCTSESCV